MSGDEFDERARAMARSIVGRKLESIMYGTRADIAEDVANFKTADQLRGEAAAAAKVEADRKAAADAVAAETKAANDEHAALIAEHRKTLAEIKARVSARYVSREQTRVNNAARKPVV